MNFYSKPGQLFADSFTKPHLKEIFEEFIEDGAAVGRDGMSVEMFASRIDSELDIVFDKVTACKYSFTSYREKLISKGAGKLPRQLSIPTVRDKLVLKFLSEFLADVFPENVSQLPHSIVRRVHDSSSSRSPSDYYLRLDIENFFPSVDHKILMRVIRRRVRKKAVLHLIQDAIVTPTGRIKASDSLSQRGIPQGLSIANILSSIYLTEIDKSFCSILGVDYFRFVDDILFAGPKSDILHLANSAPQLLRSKRKLKCHKVGDGGKSVILPLTDGIDYLGYRFCLSKIKVRDASFKKMFTNLMKIFSAMKYADNRGPLIWKLNLRISGCQFMTRKIGWLFFFSQTKDMQQLKLLDRFVTNQARKVLKAEDQERIKRFIKAYHEIRYKVNETSYFPNFDSFDDEQKRQQIFVLLPRMSREQIEALEPAALDVLFRKCIRREIADLEKDLMELFS